MSLSPRQPELAGTCEQAVDSLIAQNPALTKVAGWYIDAHWGPREHFWATAPDGTIIDPTVEQFPTGHVPALRQYQPYAGVYPCPGCGIAISHPEREDPIGFCCGPCEGATIGLPIGVCSCTDALDHSQH